MDEKILVAPIRFVGDKNKLPAKKCLHSAHQRVFFVSVEITRRMIAI